MNELIKISETNETKTVSAFELYKTLQYNVKNFDRWKQKNIVENEHATYGVDWFNISENTEPDNDKNKANDVSLSIDFAKRLAILARTEAGEIARKYFVAVEKEATQNCKTELLCKMREIDTKISYQKAIKRNAAEQLKNLNELLIDTKAEIYKQLPKQTEQTALPTNKQTELEFDCTDTDTGESETDL